VEEYDPSTDTWTTKADMPTARAYAGASVVNGKIYVIGGAPRAQTSISTVEEYDPSTDTWTKKADMPTAGACISTCVVNGKIYATGGGPSGAPTTFPFSTVDEYDPATDTWATKADMPIARGWHSTVAVNGKIYAVGGSRTMVAGGLNTMQECDPSTDTWTPKADMPTARKGLSTSVVNGNIYVIGGAGNGVIFSTVEAYDPATDTWTQKADMPTARFICSTSAVDGKVYAIGGSVVYWTWTPTSAVEEYDTGFVSASVNPAGKLPTLWGKLKDAR
jgi:N-acetylneuraminic acid mutarotase